MSFILACSLGEIGIMFLPGKATTPLVRPAPIAASTIGVEQFPLGYAMQDGRTPVNECSASWPPSICSRMPAAE